MKILFVQRREIKESRSIEIYFENILQFFPPEIKFSFQTAKFSNKGLMNRLLNMFSVLSRPKADLYHVTGDSNYLGILLPKDKTILTVHDIYYIYYAQMSKNKVVRFIKYHFNKWFFYKIPVWRARLVAVNSEFTKQELVNLTACNPDKVQVLYCPISSTFSPKPKFFNKENPRILQIGVMINKNLPRLAQALKGIPCQLEIVGKPSEEDLEHLQALNINFRWRANLSHEELLQQYAECDIVSLVSTFEGFGMPIIEAQCIERVVVTSTTASMPKVAGGGACLVDPFDVSAIRAGFLQVIRDDQYRESLIERGRKNRTKYQAQKVAQNYLDLYQKVYPLSNPVVQTLATNEIAS